MWGRRSARSVESGVRWMRCRGFFSAYGQGNPRLAPGGSRRVIAFAVRPLDYAADATMLATRRFPASHSPGATIGLELIHFTTSFNRSSSFK